MDTDSTSGVDLSNTVADDETAEGLKCKCYIIDVLHRKIGFKSCGYSIFI